MAVAGAGQLNLEEAPSWGSRSVECFEKIEQIGEGTYGQVYMASEKATGEIVALKKIRMDNEKEGFPITAIREIKILKKLKHDNVIKLKEIVTSKGHEQDEQGRAGESHRYKGSIYMVFEYMDHDMTGLAARPGMHFSVPQIKCYMKQLLTGLHYCHVNQVLHRDIKGSNLLIDNNGILKLADFGLARSFSNDSNGSLTNRVITLWYRPPELLLGSTRYGPPVDMWSVGCIFAELLHGKAILPGTLESEQIHKIFELCGSPDEVVWPGVSKLPWYHDLKPDRAMKCQLREVFKHFDRHALDLVERMLILDPSQRITAKDALDAEYFWTDPVPAVSSSLPKYESSHEFQTKKKRHPRPQQDDMAKRQKTYQQRHSRPQHHNGHESLSIRHGHSHPAQNPSYASGSGSGHYHGGRDPPGPQRHSQGGRPTHGNGHNSGRNPYVGPAQVLSYTAPPPSLAGPVGQGGGYAAAGGYPQGAPYNGPGGRGLAMGGGGGRGQQYLHPS